MSKDEIFRNNDARPGSFRFDESVAQVFPDMLRRSIPGYEATIEGIGALAARYVMPGTRCYDLGCSLGAAALAIRRNVSAADCEIHAVDLAPAMVERCRLHLRNDDDLVPVHVRVGDVRETEIRDASMVVLNYTLQFVPIDDRPALLKRIFDGMVDGGVLVLSEKVAEEDPVVQRVITDLHVDFKRRNAYSELEISRKRTALDNVLVPETVSAHRARLADAGFRHVALWLRQLNFVSFLAFRSR